ncbi:1950_t:CDS:2 [Diversispora eburnea]|uniref:1950_t:CDS:1 n=1 Tax=Diversispora eburnea TaxID=1213867 RepID=A0A9N9BCE3_9GLOM|nr:1950_t:CDS:2 [Diversispora eburnea]
MGIEITDRAVKQLKHLSGSEEVPNNALRISVEPGGCHGFQYSYDLTEKSNFKNEEDVVFEKDGTTVIVDEISLGLIKGSKLDFTEELIGTQFQIVDNPQATSGCG